MPSIIITVDAGKGNLPEVVDGIFDRSIAISNATAKFWDMNLSSSATLGKVNKVGNQYTVEIKYGR